jgi:hypothetical protein
MESIIFYDNDNYLLNKLDSTIEFKKSNYSNYSNWRLLYSNYFYPIVRRDSNGKIIYYYGFYYNTIKENIKTFINKIGNYFYEKELHKYSKFELSILHDKSLIVGNILFEKRNLNHEKILMDLTDLSWILDQIN